jgi:hypothetical protein
MAQQPKYFLIDSNDRNYGTADNFTLDLPTSLERIKEIKLKAVSLPLTHYIIDDTNNMFYFGGFVVAIDPAAYNIHDFKIHLKAKMEASAYTGIITIDYSYSTQLLTISGTVPFTLDFANTTNSVADDIGFDNVNTVSSVSHTASQVLNLNIVPYFFININNLTSNVRTTNNDLATFVVFSTMVSGQINYFFENTHYECIVSHPTLQNIQHMDISLNLKNGKPFTLRGGEWTMLLELSYF